MGMWSIIAVLVVVAFIIVGARRGLLGAVRTKRGKNKFAPKKDRD